MPAAPQFALLQARTADDPARDDERRAFAARLDTPPERIRQVDILAGGLGPAVLDGVDVLLVGGAGEFSVVNPVPPVVAFIDFLTEVAHSGLPMFASCFGFQALVLGLGGEVIADHDHAEVGTYELERTAEGGGDPLFADLPDRFLAQLGHQDRVSRFPSGAINLARSPLTPFQALRVVGQPVYATQFHPELTWHENRARFERYMDIYGALFGPERAQQQLDAHRPSPETNALMPRFVQRFVTSGR